MIRHNIPCPSPAKRPFQFVESLTTEDIAVDLVQKLDLHRISLQDILRYLFTSSHPEVLAKANSFYNHDGAAVMVKIWAKGVGRNKERLFVKAATEVVVSSGAVELDRLSKISHLRHPANAIDLDKIEDFDLEYIGQQLRESAPTVLDVITGLATVNPKKESSSTIVMICSILLFLCSQKSNHFQVMMGLYLYSCGCSSAIIDVLSKASVSVSLSSIQGALKGMTEDTLKRIRQDVQDKPWFLVYDNINFASRKLDQRIDNADAYESGTTATVVMMDDYITSDCIKSSYQHLHLDDLIPDEDSVEHIKALSEKALIDVLMRSSKTFEVCRRSPPTLQPLKPAKTITHPLPSMLINQATVAGNLEVLNTVMEQTLQLRQNWFDEDRTIVVAGDQLTVSRVSTVKEYKAIDVSPYHRLQYALPMLQLFHLKMAFCKLIMETHWGSPTQPGSLQFNKLLLRRKRVLPTNFDFHAADELLRHTFEAIVRRIWEVALDSTNLAEPVHGMSDGDIQDLVSEKVMDFMNDLLAPFPEDTDRFSRSNRNTALLLRHILIYLELCASIKNGDIGRIEEILKWITIMFQNGTNNNYGLELLHIHCAIRHVWTAEMKNKILGTWLVNTNGNENGWIPTDMYQEHNNKLIKAVYAAKGSNASWDTLASSISVNIRTFSVIKKQFENCFNRSHNSGHHSIVSAEADIEMILLSLRNAGIFGENVGTGDHDIEVALDKDLYASGLSFLSESRIDDFRKVGLSEDIDKVENEEQLEDPFL